MKKFHFPLLLLILSFVGTISAQKILTQGPSIDDPSIGVMVIQVPKDKPSLKRLSLLIEDEKGNQQDISGEIQPDHTVVFTFKLAEGKNTVSLFGLNSNNNVVFSSGTSSIFERAKDKTEIVKPKEQKKLQLFPDSVTKGASTILRISMPPSETLFDAQNKEGVYVINLESVKDGKKIVETIEPAIEKDKEGNPVPLQKVKIDLKEGTNTVTVYPKVGKTEKANLTATTKIDCIPCKAAGKKGDDDDDDDDDDDEEKEEASNFINTQGKNFRVVLGLQQVGASSANSEVHPFLNMFVSTPIGSKGVSVWGDISLTPTAIQTFAALPDLATTLQGISNTNKPNNLVDSFDFLFGIEYKLPVISDIFRSVMPGNSRSELSAIVSGGAILPLSSQNSASFYKIPTITGGAIDPRFLEVFPNAADKTSVAFVTPDRSRFFRQYYGGLRLKTFFLDENDQVKDIFPAIFDLTFGQNEKITNRMQGVIMRVDGSTPFPIKGTDFLYIFGGVQMKLGKNVNQALPPFFLETANGVLLSNASTLIVPIDQSPFLRSNRDVFRLGIAVDVFKIFKSNKVEESPQP